MDTNASLIASIPTNVLSIFEKNEGWKQELKLALATDLAPDGSFGEQWLLVDDTNLHVISREKGETWERFNFPLEKIEDAQIEPCVGNALLRVTVEQKQHNLVHFSNEQTERFALAAHYLRERVEKGVEVSAPDFASEGQHCLSCGKRLLDPSLKVCPSCIKRGQVMRRLIYLARPYWRQTAFKFLMMFGLVFLDLLPPYLTRILIDQVLTTQAHTEWLAWLVGGLLLIQIFRVTLVINDALLTNRISTTFTAGVREQMFAHLKKLSQEFYDRNETGRLMTRINQDTEELQGLINQMAGFIMNIVLVIGIGVVLFSMAPFLGLFVLIPAPFVLVATLYYHRRMNPHFRRYWISRWRLNSMLNTFLSGIQVVKAFGQDDQEEGRYQDLNQNALVSRLRVDQAWAGFFPLISFAFGAGGLLNLVCRR